MKHTLSGLLLLAILCTLTISAPLKRGHGVLHRQSPHRGLSRRIQAALAKRPMNLTFTTINPGDVSVHVKYDMSTQLPTSDIRFSATLLKLNLDDDIADSEHPSWRDTYRGRHVAISATDPVVQELQQMGVSQDDIPKYVHQNVHVADPNTGGQYRLVPNSNPEEPVSIDSSTIMITLDID